jgi:signal transduction histidine kinase
MPQRQSAVTGGHPTVRHAVESILLEERTRWAMQIHDGLTQSVTSAVLELQTLRHLIETDPDAATRVLHEIEVEIRKDLRHIRELLFEMTEEEDIPSEPTLAGLIKDFAARWRMPATVRVEGDIEALDDAMVEAAYAIASEALANAAKHSGAPDAHVELKLDADRLHIEVQDRGGPALRDPDHAGPRRGDRRDPRDDVNPWARHHGGRRAPRREGR